MHFRVRDLSADHCVWSVPAVDTIPVKLRYRMLAARAFDANGATVGERLIQGERLAGVISSLFADPRAAYLLVHYATDDSYAARVERFSTLELSWPSVVASVRVRSTSVEQAA